MNPTVGIVSAGVMGASIGARLTGCGVEVLTTTEGRGETTAERARAAGMKSVSRPELLACDILLSIVPPKDAIDTARTIAGLYSADSKKPLYVDCNAVDPDTVKVIGDIIVTAGGTFADGSIIGMPAREGYAGPTIFVSGPESEPLLKLVEFGMQIRRLDGKVGDASALKMSYGGITKGLIALGAAMMLGASRAGVASDLLDEMGRSQASLLAGFNKSIPDMFPKAGRWVAEMEEISQFLDTSSPQGRMFVELAKFYEHLASEAGQTDIDILRGLLVR